MRTLFIVSSLIISLSGLIALCACGVKAPPLPPESATPQQSDQTGWSPQRGTGPSPSPSVMSK